MRDTGPLGRAKYHLNWCMLTQSPKIETFHFLVKSGKHFDRFLQMLGLLCHQLPCISVLHLTLFTSQVTE